MNIKTQYQNELQFLSKELNRCKKEIESKELIQTTYNPSGKEKEINLTIEAYEKFLSMYMRISKEYVE